MTKLVKRYWLLPFFFIFSQYIVVFFNYLLQTHNRDYSIITAIKSIHVKNIHHIPTDIGLINRKYNYGKFLGCSCTILVKKQSNWLMILFDLPFYPQNISNSSNTGNLKLTTTLWKKNVRVNSALLWTSMFFQGCRLILYHSW